MKKVYLVTSGEYSDYHVDAVFSTRKMAKEYIDIKGTDYGIEEYDIDIPIERKTVVYCVSFYDNGKGKAFIDDAEEPDLFCYSKPIDYSEEYVFTISSDSAKKAIKIASERLMQIKAMPYLFPLLKQKCECSMMMYGGKYRNYPIYNYKTREIVLKEGHWIEE